MKNATRNEVKNLAKAMESLSHEVQVLLDSDKPVIGVANELARASSTFVFTLGSMYALDELSSSKKFKNRTTSPTPRNFHTLRDAVTGRFLPRA